jgi:hypothetical protein
MYRILTECKNRVLIETIVDRYVDGYTMTFAYGVWKGKHESTVAIDFVDVEADLVLTIAKEIKEANEQESVLVIHFPSTSTFV